MVHFLGNRAVEFTLAPNMNITNRKPVNLATYPSCLLLLEVLSDNVYIRLILIKWMIM